MTISIYLKNITEILNKFKGGKFLYQKVIKSLLDKSDFKM